MSEKSFKSRIIHKHDTEENWAKSSFIPNAGEIVIFDVDGTYSYERIKIGDGVHAANSSDLPFVVDYITIDEIDEICGAAIYEASEVEV